MTEINIMLVNSSGNYYSEGIANKPLNPNLGIAYIASLLKTACNANVKVVEIPPYRLSHKQLYKIISDFNPDILGITSKTFNILSAYDVAKMAKEVAREKQKN